MRRLLASWPGAGSVRRGTPRWLAAGGVAAWFAVSGCSASPGKKGADGAQGPGAAASAGPGAAQAEVGWKVQRTAGRPVVVTIEREGDGEAAVALVVAGAGGLVAHTALGALLEVRLRAAGFAAAGSGDRDGARVAVQVADAAAAERAAKAAAEALLKPAGEADAGAVKLASARVSLLRTQALDSPALEAFGACTGEAAPSPSERPQEAPAVAQIEAWRGRVGAAQVGAGFVGPAAVIQGAAAAFGAAGGWPEGAVAEAAPAEAAPPVSYVEPSRKRRSARVTVAVWLPDPGAGPKAAERMGQPEAPVAGKLRGLRGAFELRRVVGATRRGGSCVLVSAEGAGEPGGIEQDSAVAAAVLRQEALVEAAAAGPGVAQRIGGLGDPREAAAAAAWWELNRGAGPISGAPRARAALGLGPEPGPAQAEGSAGKRFAAEYEALVGASGGGVEVKASQERGQGQLRIVLGSPCPVVEGPAEHGLTALTLLAAAPGQGREGVAVEPWLGPDGAGVVAHAAPEPGESPEALGARVGGAAARALLGAPPSASAVQEARALLLGQLQEPPGPAQLWAQLAPEQPSRFFVWGSTDGVARASAEAARMRWARLASGPLRVAVLATAGTGQVDAVARAVERWQTPALGRACAPVPAVPAPGPGGAVLAAGPRAYLGWRVDGAGRGVGAASATALLLGEVLGAELGGLGVSARAFVAGQGAESALVVELRGSESSLEAAIDRSKGAVERLAKLAEGDEGQRALARWEAQEREFALSPRQRGLDLWRGAVRPAVPAVSEWKRWLGEQVTPAKALVLRPQPAQAAPGAGSPKPAAGGGPR